MLSYTTELPVIIYRTEIICRRYKSTLKCSQSPHKQYGATQCRNLMLPHSFLHQYGRRTDEHMGRCDLAPFLCAKKQTSHPGTQISQIRGVGEGNRGQMPHICPWSPHPPSGLILVQILVHTTSLERFPLDYILQQIMHLSMLCLSGWGRGPQDEVGTLNIRASSTCGILVNF